MVFERMQKDRSLFSGCRSPFMVETREVVLDVICLMLEDVIFTCIVEVVIVHFDASRLEESTR